MDVEPHLSLALRQPDRAVSSYTGLTNRGLQEVTTLRMLRHRNIVQFYGACLEPDCFFIVTELMQGMPFPPVTVPACTAQPGRQLGKLLASS